MSDAVYFGFQYRMQYEMDLSENGNLKTRHFLPLPSDILSWLALTVIGGVLGGASYEMAKFATKKIISKISSESENDKIANALIVLSQEEFEKLEAYILDYYEGLNDINPEIRGALFEEMVAHEMENVVEEERDPERLKDYQYLISKAIPRVEKKFSKRITEKEFKEMWKAIDLSG
jgi:hypothetical protein